MEINAEVLRQRYSTMKTEDLIGLRSKTELTELAVGVLEEVLKSRGVTAEMRVEFTRQPKEIAPPTTEGDGSCFYRKRFFGISLSTLLSMCVLYLVYTTMFPPYQPEKTNRSYLKELIQSDYIEKTAAALVDKTKQIETADTLNYWEMIENRLSECMVKEAKKLLASGDPYLDERANKETPVILAERFLKACGALER